MLYQSGLVANTSVDKINIFLLKSNKTIENSPFKYFIKFVLYFSYALIKHSPSLSKDPNNL
jgi:hypothetical protein